MNCHVRLACGGGGRGGTGQERRGVIEGCAAGPVLLVPVENVVDLLRQLSALKRICMSIMLVSDPAEADTCMGAATWCSSNSVPSKARFMRSGAAALVAQSCHESICPVNPHQHWCR